MLHVVIDTPKGSRNKLKWDEKHGLYKLSGVLFAGAFSRTTSVSCSTTTAIDVLVLMEEPAFWLPCRLIGGFYAEQTESGESPNDAACLLCCQFPQPS